MPRPLVRKSALELLLAAIERDSLETANYLHKRFKITSQCLWGNTKTDGRDGLDFMLEIFAKLPDRAEWLQWLRDEVQVPKPHFVRNGNYLLLKACESGRLELARALVREFNFDKRHLQQANCVGELLAHGIEGLRILREVFQCEPGDIENCFYENTPKAREDIEQMLQYFVEQMGGNLVCFPVFAARVVECATTAGNLKLLTDLNPQNLTWECMRWSSLPKILAQGHTEVMNYMLQAFKVKPERVLASSKAALLLDWEVRRFMRSVEWLREHLNFQPEAHCASGAEAFAHACRKGWVPQARFLRALFTLNEKDVIGYSPYLIAEAAEQNIEVLEHLLESFTISAAQRAQALEVASPAARVCLEELP